MKKIIMVLCLLCMFLTGCSWQISKEKEVGDLRVIDFNEQRVVMQHSVLDGKFVVKIICDHYMSSPEYDLYLYDGSTLLGKNGVDGVFDIDLDIDLIKHGDVLKVVEHVYYYDENDIEHHFAYDKTTDVMIQDIDMSELNVYAEDCYDFRWQVHEVIKALGLSFKTGVFNPNILYVLYTYICIVLFTIMLGNMLYNVSKYSILMEYRKNVRRLDIFNICLYILVLYVDYYDYSYHDLIVDIDYRFWDAFFKTILLVTLFIRLCVTWQIRNEWINNPPEEYQGHSWLLNARKKYLFYKNKEENNG